MQLIKVYKNDPRKRKQLDELTRYLQNKTVKKINANAGRPVINLISDDDDGKENTCDTSNYASSILFTPSKITQPL